MRVNVENMLRQAAGSIRTRGDTGGYRFMLGQLREHLKQLRDRTAVGDQAALGEFFKLYVFDDGKEYSESVRGTDAGSNPAGRATPCDQAAMDQIFDSWFNSLNEPPNNYQQIFTAGYAAALMGTHAATVSDLPEPHYNRADNIMEMSPEDWAKIRSAVNQMSRGATSGVDSAKTQGQS